MEQIWRTVQKYHLLAEDDCIVVGVSGGPDSVALLSFLLAGAPKYHYRLHAVHVNHQFRGEVAMEEAEYVRQWCQSLGVACTVVTEDVPALAAKEGWSAEEAGHIVRFRAYQAVAQAIGANKLALGHHRGDRAESLLLHLVQGCGLDGLATLPPREGWIIRPLIEMDKADLVAYCHAQQLRYFTDSTNLETVYLRNKVRLQLLPFLTENFNPKIIDTLVRLADLCQGEQAYLLAETEQAWLTCGQVGSQGEQIIQLSVFQGLPIALKRRLVRRCYEQMRPGAQNISFAQTEQVIGLCAQEKGAKHLNLSGGIIAKKSYERLIFCPRCDDVTTTGVGMSDQWLLDEIFYWSQGHCSFCAEFSPTPLQGTADFTQVVLDGDKLAERLWIRWRQPGDRLQPLGMVGRKKLKDFWIDRKVPQALRDTLPVVISGQDIIWLPGYTIGDAYKVTAQTKNFCKLCCLPGNVQEFCGSELNLIEKVAVL